MQGCHTVKQNSRITLTSCNYRCKVLCSQVSCTSIYCALKLEAGLSSRDNGLEDSTLVQPKSSGESSKQDCNNISILFCTRHTSVPFSQHQRDEGGKRLKILHLPKQLYCSMQRRQHFRQVSGQTVTSLSVKCHLLRTLAGLKLSPPSHSSPTGQPCLQLQRPAESY